MLLFETICFKNAIPKNLEYHQNRIEKSLIDLYQLKPKFNILNFNFDCPFIEKTKCRIFYNDETFKIDYEIYNQKKIEKVKVIENNEIEYNYKYTNRCCFDELLIYKENCDDVLIIKNGKVTDISYANVIFKYNNCWITPNSPLLKGTKRQYLLDNKEIIEEDIRFEDLKMFSYCKIINSMIDIEESSEIEII